MDGSKALALESALALYEREHLASRNLAPLTRKAYLLDLKELGEFLSSRCGIEEIAVVHREHLDAFLSFLDAKGLSGNYRRRKVGAIRSFFTFLEDRELLTKSPAAKLIPPQREHLEPRYLTKQEYTALLSACRHEIRDAAMIELLLQTGLRLSELSRLKVQDVELPGKITQDPGNAGQVRIYGKGRKTRTVTLNWKACKAVKAYLSVRLPAGRHDPSPISSEEALFLTKFGTGISPRSIERMVAKYLQLAGISGASVHSLRHTFGTHSVKAGTNLKVVQAVLGHTSLDTTSLYVSLARADMDREMQANAL